MNINTAARHLAWGVCQLPMQCEVQGSRSQHAVGVDRSHQSARLPLCHSEKVKRKVLEWHTRAQLVERSTPQALRGRCADR